jgi:magnesium chelatase family protein
MVKFFTLHQLNTVAIVGIEAMEIQVQIEIVKTIPSFVIVGMVNRCINESKDRIRAVFNSCSIAFPNGKIIVNLCPASIVKEGSHYDLPIIIGLLQASKILQHTYENIIFFGELSLDGEILMTQDILAAALFCYRNNKKLIVHEKFYDEMVTIFQEKSHLILVANNLLDLLAHRFKPMAINLTPWPMVDKSWIFRDIMGQKMAKKAAAISLIGRHNILLWGPPGSGKSLLSKSLGDFALPLDQEDRLIVSSIYSKAGLLDGKLINEETFRHPHHSTSYVSLLGGGTHFKPGEISLAHKGILFLDEIAEFSSATLDMLRQSMEDKTIVIGRAQYNINMPCDFQLVGAMNPCKCGYYGDKKCQCSPHSIQQYQKKLSGPLLDRIDIKLFMGYDYEESPDPITNYYKWIQEARGFIKERNIHNIANNNMQNSHIPLLNFSPEAIQIIDDFCHKNHISLRRKLKMLGVARSLADSEQSHGVQPHHCYTSVFFTSKSPVNNDFYN